MRRLLAAAREGAAPSRYLLAAAAPLVAALALAAPAQAGTYDVHFCNSAGTVFDNRSWAALASPGIVVDTGCPGANQLIGIRVDAGARSAAGAVAGLTFTSPAGTAITDFTLTRQLDYKNPVVSGTRPFFTSIPRISVFGKIDSAPSSCARSRIIVPARNESTTPTEGV